MEEEAELDLAESIFGDLEDEDDSPNPTEYRLQAIDLSSNSGLNVPLSSGSISDANVLRVDM